MAQKNIDLNNTPIKRCFNHYLLPAITGLVIKSLFIMGDTIMIGRGAGPEGLGAVALTIPFFSFFTALAMMVGIGGAATMSVQFGKRNYKEGQTLFVQSMLLTTIMSGVLVSIVLYWLDEVIYLMGARGTTAQLTHDYLSVMLQFFVLYALGWVLSCFVRNDTNPKLAMYAMAGGAILNLVLDYFFIFELGLGVKGAAYATVISQVAMFGLLLLHFITGRGKLTLALTGVGFNRTPKILAIGLPIFFIESSMAATTLIFNFVLLKQNGELYLNAFSIVANVGIFVAFVLMGIGQACQPLISFNFGSGKVSRVKETFSIGMGYAVAMGIISLIFIQVAAPYVASLFTVDNPELVEIASTALRLYFLAYPFMAVNLVTATLFQSLEQPTSATIISLARGFVFVVLGLMILPRFLPETGVWLSPLFAELLATIISLGFLLKKFRNLKLEPSSATV